MRYRLACLFTSVIVLAGCEVGEMIDPTTTPDALIGQSPLQPNPGDHLIGGSPLKPLADPLDAEIWYWENIKTGQVNHLVEVEVLVAEEQFEDAATSGAFLETSVVFSRDGKTVVKPAASIDRLVDLSPQSTGDGYALVVIALPLSNRESDALDAALAGGEVEMAAETEMTEQNGAGNWDLLDTLNALFLADPRPSPLDLPPIFN